MYVTAFNTSSGPVVVDAEGRTIGARDWGTVDTTSDEAKPELGEGGSLVVQDIADDGHPDAVAARDRTAVIAERFAAFEQLDKDLLLQAADDAGVQVGDNPHKRDLAHSLACRLAVEVPTAEPAEDTSGEQAPSDDGSTEVAATQEAGPLAAETPPEGSPAKQTTSRRRSAGRE